MDNQNPTWQNLAAEKRESVLNSIPGKWKITGRIPSVQEQPDVTGPFIQQFLSPREIEITETDAVGIVANTSTGQWSAVEVTEAFCHRASLAHQLTNCLHETFFDAALADAKLLDEHFATFKTSVGPLHGLPVSLKDQFHIKGVDTTMGYVGWIDTFQGNKDDRRKRTFESELVRELRASGAVLYCKTSVPHTLMSGETSNNIIGFTYNPKNRNLTAGGSSGGEGALIGLRGSPAGFGSDIGGSIRIPAAYNGLYGLRPSAGRIPYEGTANSMDGQSSMVSVLGPLATTAWSARLLFKSVLSQEPWLHDPLVVELPWRQSQEDEVRSLISSSSPLCFGMLVNDGVVKPHPPVLRALDLVRAVLEKASHKIIEWKPPPHSQGVTLVQRHWHLDGGADIHKDFALSGEPMIPHVYAAYGPAPTTEASASEVAALHRELRAYKKEYLDYWLSTTEQTGTGRPVDAFLMPAAPYGAARKGKSVYAGYTMILNGLDYTAITIPVTNIDAKIDRVDDEYKPISDKDKIVHEDYDPKIYDGAHVAVQLVGRRFHEEKILALAEYIGELLHQ
ncbi:hypothetical protein A1O3_03955 [Capronia epimyces CBS 606.96]|uniref:amidase n=1 Tax=Capronia epimyces CBS 606.96 TaxID=1182542 RepID=W9Y3D3_9EURO|nr:uncharacterized protein A1O3_03955 [Capronia epimyces CBS 606.96]EXJ86998.1 hypothetical protein A1O3_03955 [Capronia epimyces CBS 606.96]